MGLPIKREFTTDESYLIRHKPDIAVCNGCDQDMYKRMTSDEISNRRYLMRLILKYTSFSPLTGNHWLDNSRILLGVRDGNVTEILLEDPEGYQYALGYRREVKE